MLERSAEFIGKARSILRSLRPASPSSPQPANTPDPLASAASPAADASLLARVRERMAYPLDISAAAAKSLILRMEAPLQGLANNLAAQLLSLDDAAAQLSLWVEDALQRHGREAILATVLRRNLLLDGTILAFIDPILRGKPLQAVDAQALARGRHTLTSLLIDIAQLDDDLPAPPPDDAPDVERIAWLDDAGLSHPDLAALRAGLSGDGDADAQTHFLMSSYLLFLQSFLMRAVVGMLGDLARGHNPWPDPEPPTYDPQGDA